MLRRNVADAIYARSHRRRLFALTRGAFLRALLAWRGAILAPFYGSWRRELETIMRTRSLVPLLLSDAAAMQLLVCVRAARRIGGVMAEAGVLEGGSARLICEAKGELPLHLFDIFETLQNPSDSLGPAREQELRHHFGGVHGVRSHVEQLLAHYPNVAMHPGIFPVSIPDDLAFERFSFVHIDLDLPDSIADALAFFHPRMAPGGIILGDDYNDQQVREVFATHFAPWQDTIIELPWGQVMIVCRGLGQPQSSA